MGALPGNKNGRGNHNSGRKSAYQEMQNAQFLIDVFFGDLSLKEIKKKIKSGKYNVSDRFVERALSREGTKHQLAIVQKIFPDKIQFDDPEKMAKIDKLRKDMKDLIAHVRNNKRSN